MVTKIGTYVKHHQGMLWAGLWILLAAWASFNLGALSARNPGNGNVQQDPFRIRESAVSQTSLPTKQGSAVDRSDIRVVVSKSSTSHKYHHTWCPGAKTIHEENRVWFPDAQTAEETGYVLAGNCTP